MAAVVDPKVFESVVTIDGARGVTIRGFTFQNSPGWGIHGQGGAAFAVKDTTMQDNGSGGHVPQQLLGRINRCRSPAQRGDRHRCAKQFDGRSPGQHQQY